MTIATWLARNTKRLSSAGIGTARLDCLVLLSDSLDRDKAWLLAHDDTILSASQESSLDNHVARRARREPLSYIRGRQEFYGLTFTVTPDVLIPRPETEMLVEMALRHAPSGATIIDVGTGSGAIAIALKHTNPSLTAYGLDVSAAALAVARSNAADLRADVNFAESDLLAHVPVAHADMIVANLPYVDKSWECSAETAYEPALALFAGDEGLELIKQLTAQSIAILKPGGRLLLEADPRQHAAITAFALAHGFQNSETNGYIVALQRA